MWRHMPIVIMYDIYIYGTETGLGHTLGQATVLACVWLGVDTECDARAEHRADSCCRMCWDVPIVIVIATRQKVLLINITYFSEPSGVDR